MSRSEFLFLDLETRSAVDLKKHGAYRYFESETTDVLMARFAFDDGSVGCWLRDQPCPPEIIAHIESGGRISGWNVFGFERLAFWFVLGPRYGWPTPHDEQFDDTQQMAVAMSLPRDLGGAAEALDLPVKKDKEGQRLIRKFSIPRRARKDEGPAGLYWNEPADHPEDFAAFIMYCGTDVETERGARARLIPLSEYERDMAVIDAKINARGIRIDRKSVEAAIRLADKAKALLDREMKLATGGYVTACTQAAKLVEWVQAQGVALTSAAKAEIEDLLECDDLPPNVRRAVELRQEAAKTSVSKLVAFQARASLKDGRVRGAFLFCAAGTGRWSSTGVQMHNLSRARKEFGEAVRQGEKKRPPRADILFDLIRSEDPGTLKFFYGEKLGRTLWLLSDSIRGFIWAAPGHDLMVADYSGIEGVVAAWFAGEDWKVDAIREIAENPKLPDLYRRAAAAIFNCAIDDIPKSDSRRQVGKVSELSLQYAGGPGAFRSMARNYSLKLDPLYPVVWPAAGEERQKQALKRYNVVLARGEPIGQLLSREAFLAAECIKLGWRAAHPAIVSAWSALEDGAREAVMFPGRKVRVLKCEYLVTRGFLWCRLPSGRCLAYGGPKIKEQVWVKLKNPETGGWMESSEVMGREEAHRAASRGEALIERDAKSAVTALGVNSVTKKWERFGLYGGLAFENIVQAIARDLLANGIKKVEAADYPVIGHVHDEILSEVPRGRGSVEEFVDLMCELPDWAEGLPLTAAGWRGKRYRKD